MNNWISIKDKFPEWGIPVILFDGHLVFCGNLLGVAFDNSSVAWAKKTEDGSYEWHKTGEVTHWMPLPNPPNSNNES